ncbi:hypothetical protein [Bacillus sp. REN3]|uniref:hypothetical protein n=1 Tax=Bacillus sp. REN3 TaxID=2802440 RepID=UPI001AEEAF02|nr:hypothetical protein [Bacillus sp. REN3]
MNELLKRLRKRFKKLAILLLLIPILTAAAGYFFASQVPSTYTANSKIILGNFDKETLNDPIMMKARISSSEFLKRINKEYELDMDVDQVKSRLNVNAVVPEKTLELSISGKNRDQVEQTLKQVTKGIMKEQTNRYNREVATIDNNIEDIINEDSESEDITKITRIYERNKDKTNLRNSMIAEDVSVSENSGPSPKQSVVLGLLVGLILSVFILGLPELFREEKK